MARAWVIERRDVTDDLLVLLLEPDAPFAFAPGQYCTIGLGGVERPYSIVSSPHEPFLELFVERVPQGALTPRLWAVRAGDVLTLRPRAKGLFALAADHPTHLMVATVTGIAPFVSMIRLALHRGDPHVFHVLHGASFSDELVYDAELAAAAARWPGRIAYVPTVSRPDDPRNRGWRGATGRVNLLVEAYAAAYGLAPATTMAYACGHPGMTRDVVARLGARGFTVREERYWPE